MLGMSALSEEEVDDLAEHFTEHGAHVAPPAVVNYIKFCEAIDQVYLVGSPDEHHMSCSPSTTQLMSFKPSSPEEEEKFMHALHRLAALCKARGLLFKQVFFDIDRAPVASPARTSPFMGGKVTREQFIKRFPFKKEFPLEDVEILANNYMTDKGDVHYMAMHNDISEVSSHEPPPVPRSDLVLKPDESEWSQGLYSIVDKLRAKVVEKRVRIKEYFQDFDHLKKGFCKASQVKTVLTICDLGKTVTAADYEELLHRYEREDGMFCPLVNLVHLMRFDGVLPAEALELNSEQGLRVREPHFVGRCSFESVLRRTAPFVYSEKPKQSRNSGSHAGDIIRLHES